MTISEAGSVSILDRLPLSAAHKDIASAVAKIKGKSIEQHVADLIKDDNEAFADTRNNLTGYVKRRLEE